MSDFKVVSVLAVVPAKSVTDAVAFYERLGFKAWDQVDPVTWNYAIMKLGSLELHLRLAMDDELQGKEPNPTSVYLCVTGLQALYEDIKGKGVAILQGPQDMPYGMREFTVSDPDGCLLRFGESVCTGNKEE